MRLDDRFSSLQPSISFIFVPSWDRRARRAFQADFLRARRSCMEKSHSRQKCSQLSAGADIGTKTAAMLEPGGMRFAQTKESGRAVRIQSPMSGCSVSNSLTVSSRKELLAPCGFNCGSRFERPAIYFVHAKVAEFLERAFCCAYPGIDMLLMKRCEK